MADQQTHEQAKPRSLQLYAASNMLGVGVFTLPFLIPMVGLLPALVTPCVIGAIVAPLYQRLVTQACTPGAANPPSDQQRVLTLGGPVERLGGGAAAVRLGRLAATLRAVPTILAYLTISASAMSLIDDVVARVPSPTAVLGALVILLILVRNVGLNRSVDFAAFRLAQFWIGSLLIVQVTGLEGPARTVVLVAGVTAGIVDMGSKQESVKEHGALLKGLNREHAGAVEVLTIQLAVMAMVAGLAVAVGFVGGDLDVPSLARLPSVPQFITAAGVALFALTGTGHINIGHYATMRSPRGIKRVVRGSVAIAVAVQVLWMLATALTVQPDALAELDAEMSFSTVAIAEAVGDAQPLVGQVILVVGALLILFALSSSSHTTSESLVIEFDAALPLQFRAAQIIVILVSSVAAIVLLSLGATTTGVLAIAGLGGGLLVVFVLPILAEANAAHHRRRGNQAAAIVVSFGALSAIGHAADGALLPMGATAIVSAIIALQIGQATAMLEAHVARTPQRVELLKADAPQQTIPRPDDIWLRELPRPGTPPRGRQLDYGTEQTYTESARRLEHVQVATQASTQQGEPTERRGSDVLWVDADQFTAMLAPASPAPSGSLWLVARLGIASLLIVNAISTFIAPDSLEVLFGDSSIGALLDHGFVRHIATLIAVNEVLLAFAVMSRRWRPGVWCWLGISFVFTAIVMTLMFVP